jgi:RHS repeat-associated protein
VTTGFTSQEHDDDLGLITLHGRVYDPALKRMLTPDPYVPRPLYEQDWNPYSYAVNSPLNFSDPTGFQEEELKHTDCKYFTDACTGNALLDLTKNPAPTTTNMGNADTREVYLHSVPADAQQAVAKVEKALLDANGHKWTQLPDFGKLLTRLIQ